MSDAEGKQVLPPALLHDLRTPLNQIIGYAELLMEEADEAGQSGFLPHLQKVRAAGHQLLGLIDHHFVAGPGAEAPPNDTHPAPPPGPTPFP